MNHLPTFDPVARDRAVVERILPAFMLVIAAGEAKKQGYLLRADVVHRLNMASAAPLAALDDFTIRRLARRADDAATSLLRDLNPDDSREAIYCLATFVLLLVDKGVLNDRQNQAVLVSLLLRDDARDAGKDDHGKAAVWRLDEAKWTRKAKDLLHRANLQGLYLKEGLPIDLDLQLTA